jgi:hypothetical protein
MNSNVRLSRSAETFLATRRRDTDPRSLGMFGLAGYAVARVLERETLIVILGAVSITASNGLTDCRRFGQFLA